MQALGIGSESRRLTSITWAHKWWRHEVAGRIQQVNACTYTDMIACRSSIDRLIDRSICRLVTWDEMRRDEIQKPASVDLDRWSTLYRTQLCTSSMPCQWIRLRFQRLSLTTDSFHSRFDRLIDRSIDIWRSIYLAFRVHAFPHYIDPYNSSPGSAVRTSVYVCQSFYKFFTFDMLKIAPKILFKKKSCQLTRIIQKLTRIMIQTEPGYLHVPYSASGSGCVFRDFLSQPTVSTHDSINRHLTVNLSCILGACSLDTSIPTIHHQALQ